MIGKLVMAMILAGAISNTIADTVKVPVTQQGDASSRDNLPKRGTPKDQLIEQWGEPIHTNGPVGHPPIYRFDYNDFFVVLEGNWVVRSVRKANTMEEKAE